MIDDYRTELAYAVWDEYADTFRDIEGHYPAQAPVSGNYLDGRVWAEYYVKQSEGVDND